MTTSISFSFLTALALQSGAAQLGAEAQSLPSLGDALLNGLEVCEVGGSGGDVTLGPSSVFADLPPMPPEVRARMPKLQTTDDAPSLIKRFAETAEFTRAFGSSQIILLGAETGQVWVVSTKNKNLCSIAITKVEDAEGVRAILARTFEDAPLWSVSPGSWSENEFRWRAFAIASGRPDGSSMRVRLDGLQPEFAKPDGIQVELNFEYLPAQEAESE